MHLDTSIITPIILLLSCMQLLSRLILPMQGLVYTTTDVLELHHWMCTHFEGHPLFERVPLEELVSRGPGEIVRKQALSRVLLYSLDPGQDQEDGTGIWGSGGV